MFLILSPSIFTPGPVHRRWLTRPLSDARVPTVFNWAKAERRMPFASFRPNNTTFTVHDTVSLSPGSGNTAGLARFPRYDPISSTIPFSPGKPVPKPGSRYVRSAPRFPCNVQVRSRFPSPFCPGADVPSLPITCFTKRISHRYR